MTSVIIGTGCCGLLFGAQFGLVFVRWREERLLRDAARRTRTVALTFDDGPGPILTPKVLSLLSGYRALATFFLLGKRAVANVGLLDRLKQDGHEIGCHGLAHWDAWKTWPWNAVDDIHRGYSALERWMSPRGIFRPPGGRITGTTYLALKRRRAPFGWWTIDSGDTHPQLPDPHVVVARVRRAGGGVVLMHDFDRDPPNDAPRGAYVLQLTDLLLRAAAAEGWRVRPLGELLQATR